MRCLGNPTAMWKEQASTHTEAAQAQRRAGCGAARSQRLHVPTMIGEQAVTLRRSRHRRMDQKRGARHIRYIYIYKFT